MSTRRTMPTTAAEQLPGPPKSREQILEASSAARRHVYAVVRRTCDSIEKAAPWAALYAPPRTADGATELAGAVLLWADELGEALHSGLATLPDGAYAEYTGFYLGAVATMLRPETLRLASAIEAARHSGSDEAAGSLACEIAADVKGKGTSALMGATASLIAEGRWDPVATEPVLFAEKREEFERNSSLLASLLETTTTIHRIRSSGLLRALDEAWTDREEPPDRWAAADLSLLAAQIAQLLRPERRRALYAGDFHQLERRQRLLGARIGQLEALQSALFDGVGDERARRRIAVLLREIAGLIDAQILAELLPEGELSRLRGLLELGNQIDGRIDIDAVAQRGSLTAERKQLLALLADDDLATFTGLLAANVSRRASFALAARADLSRTDPALLSKAEQLIPESSSAEVAQALEKLGEVLARLRADHHPGARQFLLVLRLLESHSRVPDTLLAGCRPYLYDIVDEIVPRLDPLVTAGLIQAPSRHGLVADALALSGGNLRGPEAAAAMRRVADQLDILHAASVRRQSSE